jgi:hypothetical protein
VAHLQVRLYSLLSAPWLGLALGCVVQQLTYCTLLVYCTLLMYCPQPL